MLTGSLVAIVTPMLPDGALDFARLKFDYLDEKISGKKPLEITRLDRDEHGQEKITRVLRNYDAEKSAKAILRERGFEVAEGPGRNNFSPRGNN